VIGIVKLALRRPYTFIVLAISKVLLQQLKKREGVIA